MKKFVTNLLATLLALFMLTGCGTSPSASGTPDNQADNQNTEAIFNEPSMETPVEETAEDHGRLGDTLDADGFLITLEATEENDGVKVELYARTRATCWSRFSLRTRPMRNRVSAAA